MASELIDRDIYAGKYHLTHNPNARGSQPRYVLTALNQLDKPTTKPKGVTTILGAVIAKDLTQWAVDCCVDYLEPLLPMVTKEDLKEGAKAYTKKRDSGANTGTEAHALVEQYLKTGNNPANLSNASKEAHNAYMAFLGWYSDTDAEAINVEEVIYSEAYNFAGTYDAMMEIDGKVYLTDLKTTNASRRAPDGVYAENFIQLGAYALAHEEQRMYEVANAETPGHKLEPGSGLAEIEGVAVISAKKNGKLDFVTNESIGLTLQDCMSMARRTVDLYNFLQFTTKQLGGK